MVFVCVLVCVERPQKIRKRAKSSVYQSKTICENKNVSYEAHLCPIIVKAQRAPNAQATLQIVDRHYEEFLSPTALTLKPLRRPSNRLSPDNILSDCAHI
jgi:hypothetical protein